MDYLTYAHVFKPTLQATGRTTATITLTNTVHCAANFNFSILNHPFIPTSTYYIYLEFDVACGSSFARQRQSLRPGS